MQSFMIDIRQRRQATFPASLLDALGISQGDAIEIEVVGKQAILRPKKQIALDALSEIQELFKYSGVAEKELQETLNTSRNA